MARNYLAQARVLAESFLRHHAGWTFSVLVVDGPGVAPSVSEPFELLRPRDLDLDAREFRRIAAMYDVMELATAVKPWLLELLLKRGAPVVYLDPDIEVFRPLADVAELAEEHGIVLTPHISERVPYEARELVEQVVLGSGIYNLGFVAVSEAARSFLDWWKQRLSRECLIDVARRRFVDQRWVDFAPGLFDHHIVRDRTWNVAWWNLGRRAFRQTGRGYEVEGVPLTFFHYSGYDPKFPYLLSKFQGEDPAILLSRNSDLQQICDDYAAKLRAAGFDAFSLQPYGFDATELGLPIDPRMRLLYRRALLASEDEGSEEPPNPFDDDGGVEFLHWLREPSDPVGDAARVSRYLQLVHRRDDRLSEHFRDLRWLAADRYLDWVRRRGWLEAEIPPELSPSRRPTSREEEPPPLERGLNIAGYLRAELGVGEAARLLVRGVEAAGIPHGIVAYTRTVSRQLDEIRLADGPSVHYDTNLICVNADELPTFAYDVGPSFFRDRYSIGVWFWELREFPEHLHEAFDIVDEVWVASDFVRTAVAAGTDKPVLTMPIPVPLPRDGSGSPPYVPDDRFVFLFSFDFMSVFDRKNPLAVVEAFSRAFAPSEGPILLVKSINGDRDVTSLERLRYAGQGRDDILIVDEYVNAAEKDALTARCDCYVSLHRSEGFGLTLAEAMAWGKPVIATGYSGNLAFMDDETAYLVPYDLIETERTAKPYPEGIEWAEPNIDEAARLLRRVYENPDEARERGESARRRIGEYHSLDRTGQFVTRRLEEIESDRDERHRGPREPKAPTGLRAAERYVESGPEGIDAAAAAHGRIGKMARSALFRILRPYIARHRHYELAVVEALQTTDDQLASLVEELENVNAAHLDRLERIERRLRAFETVVERALEELAQRGDVELPRQKAANRREG